MTHQEEFQGALVSSSLHVQLMLVAKVLTRSGFGDVQLLGRRLRAQKSKVGGCELMCHTNLGGLPFKVIVKFINDGVRTRMLDEMAGAIDRTKADFGIVVSTEDLSPRLAKNQAQYQKSRVEVIDGKALASLLIRFKIGTRPNGSPDYAYFTKLEEQSYYIRNFLSHASVSW
ncbi:MAG: restriction endonuclease [Armatimonadetes bacterium]|nr:restriction endonuclease [Armatimonadota bacterium]